VTNKSNHNDYKEIYNTDTIKIVADVYRKDIEILGYSFDNSSIKEQLSRREINSVQHNPFKSIFDK